LILSNELKVTYEVVGITGLGDACVDDEVDDDWLSLGSFPCVDADDVADGEVLDADLVGHGQVDDGVFLCVFGGTHCCVYVVMYVK